MADWLPPEAACGRLPLEGATPAVRQSRSRAVHLSMVVGDG
jgi:hypothetical protein